MSKNAILVLNAGSSSLKFGLFELASDKKNTLRKILSGQASNLRSENPTFEISVVSSEVKTRNNFSAKNVEDIYEYSTKLILESIDKAVPNLVLLATAHRVVHGGDEFKGTVEINNKVLESMERYIPLAALHQPFNIKIAKFIFSEYPLIKHFACFDTAFHQTIELTKRIYAIPLRFLEKGIKRYGFHGLSYQYISGILESYVSHEQANKKWVIAHLGSGSSLCAIENKKSVATSMGFSVLDGLPMSTRPGELDPAIITFIQEHEKMDLAALNNLLYKESGLLGLSGGISSDIKTLADSEDPKAKFAIQVFTYLVSINIGKMVAALQGCDGIIFTAGIGQNSALIRELICSRLEWLGVKINQEENIKNSSKISMGDSMPILVLPTDEEYFMAQEAEKYLGF